jgi:hypothetical protein
MTDRIVAISDAEEKKKEVVSREDPSTSSSLVQKQKNASCSQVVELDVIH